MSLPIYINNKDFTDVFEYTKRSEIVRRVQGKNNGVSMAGEDIYDDLANKYDLQTSTKPVRPERLTELWAELMYPPATVSYYSFLRDMWVTQEMRVENLNAVLGLLKKMGDEIIIGNISIYFRQK